MHGPANQERPARIPPPGPCCRRRWPGRACPATAAVPRCLAGDLRPGGPALLSGRFLPEPAELAEPRAGQVRDSADGRGAAAACGCSSTPRGPERAGRPPPRLFSSPEAPGGVTGAVPVRRVSGCKMTNEEPLPKKVRLSETDFKVMARDELILRWKQYEAYVQALEGKYTDLNSNDVTGLRESEEKLKQQQQESARRENILVMRLATKEQEMQECTTQIQYLKQVQQPSVAQLRSTMVDPAINLFFLKMKGELEQTKDKLEQAQNELSAWKFTPDSQTGKKLMAKCRMLIQENQELGRQLSQGRIAQLEAELALQKKYSEELKSSQDELNDFIIQLDEEVEGMQSTILVLQQQLKETRQQLAQYQQQQSQASAPSTSRTTSSEPVDQAEATSKDCSRLANGPSNGSSSRQRTSGSGCHREGNTTEDDFPPSSSGNGNKASNSSEERTGRGGSSYINPLSAGYESVDSPTGSENSLTHHSNDTDSSHDPQEEKAVSGKGNRTVGSRHIQNGLDSSVNVQGSVL